MKGYRKYFLNKLLWFLITFVFAFLLNFILPRLMPGAPAAASVSPLAPGLSNPTRSQAIDPESGKAAIIDPLSTLSIGVPPGESRGPGEEPVSLEG